MGKRREFNFFLFCAIVVVVLSLALLAWSFSAMAADVSLVWDASTGATSYKVQMSPDGGKTWGEIREAGAETKFV